MIMLKQGSGSIVNVSSVYGARGFPDASRCVASKHAIIGLTKSAALEGAPLGVRVNAVGPGQFRPACSTASPAEARKTQQRSWAPSR
jgi:NAD(P)-dependent dehydrogenase (short-subunit alcohol dehydrogenase family)